jgi:hypothetical protein
VPASKTKTKRPRATRYLSHEEQAEELLAHLRRRERRVYEALLMLLSVRDEKLLRSFAILMDFVVGLAQRSTVRPRSPR